MIINRVFRRWLITIAVLFVVAIIAFAITVIRQGHLSIDNAYAEWSVGDMIVDFMERNDGKWPSSWNDLSIDFSNDNRVGGWSLADYSERVRVDWNANPDDLARASLSSTYPTFNVIGPEHGFA